MTTYRCVIADLLTDTTLTEMDLSVDTCERRIIVPGAFRASYPMPNLRETERGQKVVAGRTAIHMMRGNDIWGTYPVWYADPSEDEQGRTVLQIQGSSLESYALHRKIRANLAYTGQDQIDIARALLTHMADVRPGGYIGLQPAAGTSGVTRDVVYRESESVTYGERLEQLANMDDQGFEYMIRSFVDPATGQRARQWVWATTLGTPGVTRDITQPGKIKSWSYPSDASQAATAWQARGDTIQDDLGADSEPLMSDVYEATDLLAAGWPLLDRTEDYPKVRDQTALNGYAQKLAATRSGAVSVPRVTVHFDDTFSINPNYLGDTANFTLVNNYFPLGPDGAPVFSKTWRIVGMNIKPPTSDDGEERAELIFEEAT